MKIQGRFSLASMMIFLFLTLQAFASNPENDPKIGDRLIIKSPKNTFYTAVNMPKLNFIVKKGGTASYKSVRNVMVQIVEISRDRKGRIMVVLERVDGSKFFGIKNSVRANYQKALEIEELKKA